MKNLFKKIALTLTFLLSINAIPTWAATTESNKTKNEFNKNINSNLHEMNNITTFSNIIGGGGDNGSFTYFKNGAVVYSHGECMNMVLYLPSSFIAKMERVANNGVAIAGLLGVAVSNPIAAAAVVVIGANWSKILWLDNGNGVSMIINWPTLAPPMQSGCNYYMGH